MSHSSTIAEEQQDENPEDMEVIFSTLSEGKFTFRTDKKTGIKRPAVTLKFPVPTYEGLIAAVSGSDKVREYVLGIVHADVAAAVRKQVDDGTSPVNKQEELDIEALNLESIAAAWGESGGGRGIPKETWDAFEATYNQIMPALTKKTAERVANAAKLLKGRLQACKTNKPVLGVLKDQLDFFFVNAGEAAEEFMAIYEFLNQRIDTYLNVTDEDLVSNL